VFAEIRGTRHHAAAVALLTGLAASQEPWAIPWPCIYELVRVVTHPRVFHPPMPLDTAVRDIRAIFSSPSLVLLSETHRHAELALSLLKRAGASGNLAHDAHIAALCLEHGVRELVTADRDFSRFPELKTVNPFGQ
jgi:toxin-antitoxin system PIN domain toxin